jgi:transposase-like protein
MYLAGVSVRRVEDITEALWGSRVSPSTVSELNKKIYKRIDQWRNRPLHGEHPYVYLDGLYLKRSWGGEVQNIAVLVAFGVNHDGYREILGVCEGAKEDKASWLSFIRHLKNRGLRGTKLFISDKCIGLVEALGERSMALWRRNPRNEVLVHSDQGSQYGSDDWHRFCRDHGLKPSKSRRGDCWDNAVAESFFSSLKMERIKRKIYSTRKEARKDLFDNIEMFYNPERRHSHNGGVSPEAFENASGYDL